MSIINYDFSTFINVFAKIKENGLATPTDLRALKNELNSFFKDSSCKEVLYTNNNDKMFFGIKITAMIDADDIFDYLVDTEPARVKTYVVEIDSHLLNPIVDLSAKELTAMFIHEVAVIINDATPVENARTAMNNYLAANKEHLKIS